MAGTIPAVLDYSLPADGLDWHFSIADTLNVVASKSSVPVMEAFVRNYDSDQPNAGYRRKVMLTYRLTGKKATLTGGWGTSSQVDEIDVKNIKPR